MCDDWRACLPIYQLHTITNQPTTFFSLHLLISSLINYSGIEPGSEETYISSCSVDPGFTGLGAVKASSSWQVDWQSVSEKYHHILGRLS